MNTFIVGDTAEICAEILDSKRLGKQRLECLQILNALQRTTGGWINHPAVLMWKGHEDELKHYANSMIIEWKRRGFKNTMELFPIEARQMPDWFRWERLQKSHRASLLRKNKEHYQAIFDAAELEEYMIYSYIWPSKLPQEFELCLHLPLEILAQRLDSLPKKNSKKIPKEN